MELLALALAKMAATGAASTQRKRTSHCLAAIRNMAKKMIMTVFWTSSR